MTILTINLRTLIAGLAIVLAASQSSWAQDSPHWNKGTCGACHVEAAPVAGSISLKESDAESLCESCHGDRGDAKSCRHLSDIPVGDVLIPERFQASLKDEQVVCTTCHDVVYQCERPKLYYSFDNPGFLRDRDYAKTGEYCLECHDTSGYEKLNPHKGVTGTPPKQTCTLCHENVPSSSKGGVLDVTFNMRSDLNDTCRGCHDVRPHPLNLFAAGPSNEWIHLVVPPDAILENMRESEDETGVILPLNSQNGEIFCATCHNPHEFKVGGGHGSQSANAKHRLRLNNICQACHDK